MYILYFYSTLVKLMSKSGIKYAFCNWEYGQVSALWNTKTTEPPCLLQTTDEPHVLQPARHSGIQEQEGPEKQAHPRHSERRGLRTWITNKYNDRILDLNTDQPELAVTFIKQPACLKQPYSMFPNFNSVLIFTSAKQPPVLSSHFLCLPLVDLNNKYKQRVSDLNNKQIQ